MSGSRFRLFCARANVVPRMCGAVTFGALAISSPAAWADNPIVQTLYTADPAPLVHDGILYLYTTHDEDVTVNDFFTMNDWRVYSTTDVVNWTDHGSPLHYMDFSWASGNAWAPQVIHRNGTFYFYVPVVRTNGSNAIGVATSDSPFGPFEDAIGSPLVTSDCGDIDPTVFIDDDDQAYLYWGNPNLCYVRLNEDMSSYQGDVVHVPMNTNSFGTRTENDRPTSYEEGPWFYKREGTYYMVYPGGPLPEHIAYSTSPAATGPWSYGGVIMPAEGASFTNHPGVVDYKGKSLFFYHNGALPGGGGFKRSVCVEEFTYGADGSFPQLRMTTEGASAVDVLNPFAQTEAETIAWQSGIETELCDEGGLNVTDIDTGDYIKLKEVEFGAGATLFEARVAAATSGGAIELRLDAEDGMLIGTCAIESTGGEQSWATQSCAVSGASDKHDLFLKFTGGGFKFNWWKFEGTGDPGTAGAGGEGGVAGNGGSAAAGSGGLPGSVGGAAGTGGNAASAGAPAAGNPGVGGAGPTPATPTAPVGPPPPSPNNSGMPVGVPSSAPPGATPTGTGMSSANPSPTTPGGAAGAFGSGGPSSGEADEGECGCRVIGGVPPRAPVAFALFGFLALATPAARRLWSRDRPKTRSR